MTALLKSSKGLSGPSNVNLDEYFALLGLDSNQDTPIDISEIRKAYKKKALKAHPDKGGSALEFNKLNDALNILITRAEEIEQEKYLVDVYYEVVIKKVYKCTFLISTSRHL